MKSFIVAHFRNGVIIEFKRKPKAQTPQPLTLKVATNAVKRLNETLRKHRENYPQNSIGRNASSHWACVSIDKLAELNKRGLWQQVAEK